MDNKIRVAVVDDHEIFRKGLKMVLSKIAGIQVVLEAANGQEFLDQLDGLHTDLVLMDVQMPGLNGIETTRAALEKRPKLKIVALSMFNDEEYVEKLVEAGVKGYLLKNINKENLKKAIEVVHSGKNYFSDELWSFFARKVREKKRNTTPEMKFTRRETEILQLLAEGLSNVEIAERLFISERTVVGHKSNLLSKTGCKNTIALLAFAIKNDLINY